MARVQLDDMVIFARVAEAHSFTRAARALGIPTSTVSRRVAQLEESLGVRLLHRTTRKLSLTDIGAAYAERCLAILAEVEEANSAVSSASVEPAAQASKVDVQQLVFPARLRELGRWLIRSEISGQVPFEITYFTSGLS